MFDLFLVILTFHSTVFYVLILFSSLTLAPMCVFKRNFLW